MWLSNLFFNAVIGHIYSLFCWRSLQKCVKRSFLLFESSVEYHCAVDTILPIRNLCNLLKTYCVEFTTSIKIQHWTFILKKNVYISIKIDTEFNFIASIFCLNIRHWVSLQKLRCVHENWTRSFYFNRSIFKVNLTLSFSFKSFLSKIRCVNENSKQNFALKYRCFLWKYNNELSFKKLVVLFENLTVIFASKSSMWP